MKKLERLFRKIGNADVHVWGYSTLGILTKRRFKFFSFQVLVILKV